MGGHVYLWQMFGDSFPSRTYFIYCRLKFENREASSLTKTVKVCWYLQFPSFVFRLPLNRQQASMIVTLQITLWTTRTLVRLGASIKNFIPKLVCTWPWSSTRLIRTESGNCALNVGLNCRQYYTLWKILTKKIIWTKTVIVKKNLYL